MLTFLATSKNISALFFAFFCKQNLSIYLYIYYYKERFASLLLRHVIRHVKKSRSVKPTRVPNIKTQHFTNWKAAWLLLVLIAFSVDPSGSTLILFGLLLKMKVATQTKKLSHWTICPFSLTILAASVFFCVHRSEVIIY